MLFNTLKCIMLFLFFRALLYVKPYFLQNNIKPIWTMNLSYYSEQKKGGKE